MRRRLRVALPTALAVFLVLSAYAFFGSGGSFNFRRLRNPDDSYYASLAQGFFSGHLYMSHRVNPRLLALPNPYDPNARAGIDYLWDASYLNGKYYLYFSPLPALIFYMPYRLLRGAYPSDALAGVAFSAWAFLAAVLFAHRALSSNREPLSKGRLHVPFSLWVVLIGLGNLTPFLSAELRVYEVSVMAGSAMTAMWASSSIRFSESPTARRAMMMSIWLALSIAARPNLGVLLFVAAFGITRALKRRQSRVRTLVAAIVPLAVVAVAMLWYNVARFGTVGEFGHRYQLTGVSMEGRSVCRVCNAPEVSRWANSMVHYVFWPVSIRTEFPFVKVQPADLDPAVSFPGTPEEVVGVVPLIPLTLLGALFAFLIALRRGDRDGGTHVGIQVMVGAWLVMFGLSACWWVVSRYEVDFMLLMVAASVVCVESGLTFLEETGVRVGPLRLACVTLACYSILLATLLGFVGRQDAFRRFHPEKFEQIAHRFSMKP